MRGLKIILLTHIFNAISISFIGAIENMASYDMDFGSGFITTFIYAILGGPLLIFYVAFHLIIRFFRKRGNILRLSLMLLYGILCGLLIDLIFLIPNFSIFSYLKIAKLLLSSIFLSVHTVLYYYLAANLINKYSPTEN
jgi:hypothetical protein